MTAAPPIVPALDSGGVTFVPSREIAGILVADVAGEDAIAALEEAMTAGRTIRLAFLNAHCVNVSRRDGAYRRALRSFLVLPDGVGVDLAGSLLHGAPFRENLNGTDFIARLLASLQRPCRVALLGGRPGIAEAAAERLAARYPRHDFIAVSDGYFGPEERSAVLDRLAAAKADIVLVALGVPAQERFIADHLDAHHGHLFAGVGALLDFMAGRVSRAPEIVRALRLEWVWRLALEPRRLWRRYVLGNPVFLAGILRDRLLASRGRR